MAHIATHVYECGNHSGGDSVVLNIIIKGSLSPYPSFTWDFGPRLYVTKEAVEREMLN